MKWLISALLAIPFTLMAIPLAGQVRRLCATINPFTKYTLE